MLKITGIIFIVSLIGTGILYLRREITDATRQAQRDFEEEMRPPVF